VDLQLAIPEPWEHKLIEDLIGWGLEGAPEVVVDTHVGSARTVRYRPVEAEGRAARAARMIAERL
jgi:hypothetical protein